MKVNLPEGYRPSDDEPYMNPTQREYFRRNLLLWRAHLREECTKISWLLEEESSGENVRLEQGAVEGYWLRKLKTRNRYLKLIDRINHALNKINDGTYGYCEETGEEIGIRHLQAQPTATLCPAAQQRREQMEGNKQAGDAQ
jgi:DnaK suppressor protein